MANVESKYQQSLIKWWAYAHKGLGVPDERLLMAFPLQAARTPRNGGRMRAEGTRKGTPDMLLAVSRKGCHGMFIEMKADKGKLSETQEQMLALLETQGYLTKVCFSFDSAMDAITEYLRVG